MSKNSILVVLLISTVVLLGMFSCLTFFQYVDSQIELQEKEEELDKAIEEYNELVEYSTNHNITLQENMAYELHKNLTGVGCLESWEYRELINYSFNTAEYNTERQMEE